ncbi:MAG: hypothetical protein WEA58_14930 [Balneolaceae bacterium]
MVIVGPSDGRGVDIDVKDIIYIVGENDKFYYYDESDNDWIREPGGGWGKRISYQLNSQNSASPRLYMRGGNDDIYYKTRGSSSGWIKLINYNTRALSTIESTSSSPISSLTHVDSNYNPYYSGSPMTIDYVGGAGFGKVMQAEEMAGSFSQGLYAAGWIFQPFPPVDYGDRIFKFNSSEGMWELIDGIAKDIAMGGPQDDVWMIGDNNKIYKRVNNDWVPTETGTGKRIAVADDGTPYIIGENNKIYKFVEQ